ncbi:sulfate ABC transporter substrate-binding protein [Salinisphaera sp. Q1T1-3]|uniref:sulfate ABC transporter substrate-binding protein n=1 Tax=Salinisphaera sp. Q1T1-3 TaxID=2321229 RepID=UPI000E72A01D|nr:sulfate ABC transporter substrate-binding protein [Salinisphaera sp. Q1T1-3]RJS95133.1 sulfate ABC transporter substrate-binding protein [Salinisphaera sp. Q1T1-3]
MPTRILKNLGVLSFVTLAGVASLPAQAADQNLLNVSFSVTRQVFQAYDPVFAKYWKQKTGHTVDIHDSYGGSGSQSRAVIAGLDADVVTLSAAADINAIADKTGLIAKDWRTRLPNDSSPYYTPAVFLVRKGNPNIHGWADLTHKGVQVITANPKTSGAARWNFLAAWEWAARKGGDEAAKKYVTQLYKNVPMLPASGRKATTAFTRGGTGDVMITYEYEAKLAQKNFPGKDFQIVYPKYTISIQPPVAVVDKTARQHGTTELAQAYLKHLWSDEGQQIIADNDLRPRNEKILAAHAKDYPKVETFTVPEKFGSWRQAQKRFFDEGAIFDQIYRAP